MRNRDFEKYDTDVKVARTKAMDKTQKDANDIKTKDFQPAVVSPTGLAFLPWALCLLPFLTHDTGDRGLSAQHKCKQPRPKYRS